MNIQWKKHPRYNWSCPWNLYLLLRFSHFWKDKSLLILKLFISQYLAQIPTWKMIKEACFQLSSILIIFVFEIKQSVPAQVGNIIQSSRTLIRISGSIPEVRKHLHWSMIGIVLDIEKNMIQARHWQKNLICSKSSWGV